MKVVATKKGYYGGLREPGDEFTISSEDDLGSWMHVVDDAQAEPGDEKDQIIAELKTYGVTFADKPPSLAKLRAKLAEAKGE